MLIHVDQQRGEVEAIILQNEIIINENDVVNIDVVSIQATMYEIFKAECQTWNKFLFLQLSSQNYKFCILQSGYCEQYANLSS